MSHNVDFIGGYITPALKMILVQCELYLSPTWTPWAKMNQPWVNKCHLRQNQLFSNVVQGHTMWDNINISYSTLLNVWQAGPLVLANFAGRTKRGKQLISGRGLRRCVLLMMSRSSGPRSRAPRRSPRPTTRRASASAPYCFFSFQVIISIFKFYFFCWIIS